MMLMMLHFLLLLCDSATENPVFDVSFGLSSHFLLLFGYSNYNKLTSKSLWEKRNRIDLFSGSDYSIVW